MACEFTESENVKNNNIMQAMVTFFEGEMFLTLDCNDIRCDTVFIILLCFDVLL